MYLESINIGSTIFPVSPKQLTELARMVSLGVISRHMARVVFREMMSENKKVIEESVKRCVLNYLRENAV
jgi:Asp-tRNA(Asn)/Glu-tRNA(Gln) amidotransferase B subunit